ncbi:glutamate-rich protein 3 [Chamaea fasciata]|uniref:glutamate-rich protein 3 n=1 Tax=Chamaea fasciata TaxID=190680 RepID=UPI00336A1AD5
MSAPQPRLLETYNSLTDKHLVGYFSNARIRRHLQKSGLVSRSGRIIPEKEYRLNAMRRDHQKHVLKCLADAISHKILDMERHHQREVKRRRECSRRSDRMQPVEVENVRTAEEITHVHCPHPPPAPRCHHELCPLAAGERACHSHRRAPGLDRCCGHYPHQHQSREHSPSKVSSLRPNTAPGNVQQLPHLQPLPGWAAARSVPKASKQKCHALEHDQHFACGGERNELRLLDAMAGVSPYRLPVIGRCLVPVPPPGMRGRRRRALVLRPEPSTATRFYPTTGFNEQVLIRNTRGYPKSPLCSNAFVTMVYRGKSKHVSHREYKDEIRVYQQHCGTENICVYKGELLEGDTFQFTSKRHLGFPFSLTFYLNGLQVERLSSCCEYRYQRCSQLRGTNNYFRVLHVTGAPPCYRCIAAMGLDKKLFPPKKRRSRCCHKPVCCWGHALHCDPCDSIEQKSVEESVSATVPCNETSVETEEETLETAEESSEEETEDESSLEDKESQRDTSHSEYDDDFEPDEEVNEEGQTGDQMNGVSESSSDDKTRNLDDGKESETSSQKVLQGSDSEKDESDGCSDGRGSEDDQQVGRPAGSVSSMSTQCSTDTDPHDTMTDNVNGKEDCNIKSPSDSAAHAPCGNENGEKKLLRMEENQETSALGKKGIDEAEKAKPEAPTAREDSRIFHENIMAMQHDNPEVNGEFKQTELGESDTSEEEKCPPVPWESRALNVEDGKEESPCCEEGAVFEDCKLVQEEIEKATGNDCPVNSDPEPGDLCASEEEKNAANTEHGVSGAPDGSSLARGKRSPDVQEAAGGAVREGLETGQGQGHTLQQDGAAEGGAGSAENRGGAERAGHSLPQAGAGAALEESTPGEHPREKGTGGTMKLGTEVSPGEHQVLVEGEVALGKAPAGGQGPAGALPGWEADRAVPRGQEGAGGITEEEEEEAAEEGPKGAAGPPAEEEEAGEAVSQAGQSPRQGGSAGKDAAVGAVPEGEEAVEGAGRAAGGIAGAAGPEREEAVEEDISEGQEAMGKPGALREALGDVETGEAAPGGEAFVKPSEFSQLKASGEEWLETGKAVTGAAELESAQAWEVGGKAPRRVEDTMEESVEPGTGPVREAAPGSGARGAPATGGSVRAEETPAAQEEEEGAAEALWSVNPSQGSKAETERAERGRAEGEVVGGSAGAAGAGSGGDEEAAERAAGSEEAAAGTQGWLGCGEGRGKGRSPGEGVVGEAGLCGPRAGEPGLVAIAVLGGHAGPGAPGRGPAVSGTVAGAVSGAVLGGPAVAGAGTGAMAQEVTGAERGAQGGPGPAVAQEVTGAERGAVAQSGRDGEGVGDGPAAGGREESQEAAGGCEGRGAVPAGAGGRDEAQREPGAVLGAPRHGEVPGTMSLGEGPAAETSPSPPARGDGPVEPGARGSAAGEGLCPTAPGTGTARGRAGMEQGMEQAGVKAEGERPSPCEDTRESAVRDVWESAGSAAGAAEQSKDGPVGAGPGVLAAAGAGERSRRPRQDGAHPDPPIASSERPQDGEEALL